MFVFMFCAKKCLDVCQPGRFVVICIVSEVFFLRLQFLYQVTACQTKCVSQIIRVLVVLKVVFVQDFIWQGFYEIQVKSNRCWVEDRGQYLFRTSFRIGIGLEAFQIESLIMQQRKILIKTSDKTITGVFAAGMLTAFIKRDREMSFVCRSCYRMSLAFVIRYTVTDTTDQTNPKVLKQLGRVP